MIVVVVMAVVVVARDGSKWKGGKGREGVIGYGTYTVRYSSTVRVSYSDRKVCK